jgi:peptidoglycan/xylan/chitin deacetylase (PgdA/CDA1 family)
MPGPVHLEEWQRTLRRRRLATIAAAGLVAITAAAAVDVVIGRSAPDLAASSPAAAVKAPLGEQAGAATAPVAVTVPPWVWAQPPSAPAPLPSAPGVAPVITRIETTDPVVFLTIDDGVTRSPEAAAEFRELGIPASLFLVDGPIEAAPGWFGALPGTLVESHTRTHPDMTTLSESAQRDEICGNADLIERTYGRRPVLFRPPFGKYDDATRRAAAACGMRAVVIWQETVNNDVVRFREVLYLRPGDIILMHFRPSFVQELNVIRQRVQDAGLRFALLEDYVAPDTVPAT